ncbi:MAG: single-stranded DNA-binding protein [Treponema sp.]|nr:single-stranded DNA-binding protein [Treponema sp.]
MTDLNHVVLIGRLTKDLGTDERSFGYISSGQARANISIAVNRSRKNGDTYVDEVNYFDVTIWGKTAENLKPYLLKGKQIAIDGYLKQDRWEKDGQKQSKVVVVANNVQLLGGKGDGAGSVPSGAPKFQPNSAASNDGFSGGYQSESFGETGSDFPEDIPF